MTNNGWLKWPDCWFSVRLLWLVTLSLLVFACQAPDTDSYKPLYRETPPKQENIYSFGVHPLHNPRRLFEIYQPLMDYLNARLTGVTFRLEASRNYAAYDEKLLAGHFHFALPNPYQTIQAAEQGYRIFGKMADDENFYGIILVRKDSAIQTVADLKGKAVSYPAPTALAATMMPQWYLYQQGLDINQDIENRYVGSQESSIMNVYLGHTAAGATWPPPWQAFSKEHPEIAATLEVRWRTASLPNNGLVVRNDVPAALLDQVSQLLFHLHEHPEGAAILAAMALSRFEAANSDTYGSVRHFLRRFEQELRPVQLPKTPLDQGATSP